MVKWHEMNRDWQETFKMIKEKYGHYFWVHVLSNAAIATMALLYSEGNFKRGITIAVQSGWDTDCNGATVGSILGTYLGYDRILSKWVKLFDDKVLPYIPSYSVLKISGVARRAFNRCVNRQCVRIHSSMDILKFLKSTGYLKSFSKDSLDKISKVSRIESYKKNSVIFTEFEKGNFFTL